MTKNELLRKLQMSISTSEKQALMNSESKLVIGKYNRQSMLDLLMMREAEDQNIDVNRLNQLKDSLQIYLDRYMEQKEGHKWVILASIYHAFILGIPLHPLEVTKIKMVQKENHIEYYCPCRDTSDGSLCHFCVCQEYENEIL